ncbi:MAG TPA: hypothetical protein VG297_08435 [Bryobacteraceae bacterium]|jgi:hypothetical protein|nr:hypothetical protein [Bryobacteraceae bacterium]
MRNPILGCALVVVTGIVCVSPLPAQRGGGRGAPAAPAGPMPRLPDGHPDMQGFWNPPAITDIEPAPARGGGRGAGRGGGAPGGGAPGGAARGGGGAAAAGFGGFAGAGNRIIDPPDGKIPYKPEARAKQQDILQNHMADEPELHCYESGIPHSESNQFGAQIIQTPGYFVQLSEFMHTVRIIPTDGRPHIAPKIKLFEGDPVGHWEGDTLVVDTTNQNTKTWFDTSGNFKTENLHVTEKFIPQDANTIVYEATITDPDIYTQPWTARWNIGRNRNPTMSDGHPYEQMEFGCIEGNEDLQHYTEDKGGKVPRKR